MRKVFLFDLDDTLINTRQRHYSVYQDFLKCKGVPPLTFEKYAQLRKNGHNNKAVIATHSKDLLAPFEEFWKTSIESQQYLALDTLLVDISLLKKLKEVSQASFILLSLRSNPKTAEDQFDGLPFASFFEERLFLQHSKNYNPKIYAIRILMEQNEIEFFIGDTASDQEASEYNHITFFGTRTGWIPPSTSLIFDNINFFLKEKINEYRKG
jgi:phosphoglycolate phosphatase-like HAD superfamily hydrolase